MKCAWWKGLSGIEFIPNPILRIGDNVIWNTLIGLFITNDVFVIIPLPDIVNVGVLAHPFGYANFETTPTSPTSPSCIISIMPWMWLGIMMYSCNRTFGKWSGIANQHCAAILPASFRYIVGGWLLASSDRWGDRGEWWLGEWLGVNDHWTNDRANGDWMNGGANGYSPPRGRKNDCVGGNRLWWNIILLGSNRIFF